MDSGTFNSSVVNNSSLVWYQCRNPLFFLYITCDMSNSLLGLPTNLLVLVLILMDWWVQAAQEIFTLNLAVVEIIYCFLSQGLVLNYLVFKRPDISEAFWFVFGLNICGRSLFQCGMSVERYMAVAMRYRVMFLMACWPLIIVLCIYNHLKLAIYTICFLFLLVLVVDSFCSLSILKVLQQPGPGDGEKRPDETNTMKKKASGTVLIIQASVMFNYIPVFFVAALKNYVSDYIFACVCEPLGFSFGVMGSFIQPLLYLYRMGKLPWTAPK